MNSTTELLNEAMARMDRARGLLTKDNPTPANNWGMLDTSDLRAHLASMVPEEQPVAEWVNEEQGFQYLVPGRLPEGTQLYSGPSVRAPSIKVMVDRFLGWKVPETFYPDCGITFTKPASKHPYPDMWPIGTNILTAVEAEAMFEYVLADAVPVVGSGGTSTAPTAQRLKLLEGVIEQLKLRITVRGWPAEIMWEIRPGVWVPDWRKECNLIDNALHGSPLHEDRWNNPPAVPRNQIKISSSLRGEEIIDREASAKEVYNCFIGSKAHPWADGGNSNKQNEARMYSSAALSVLRAPKIVKPEGDYNTTSNDVDQKIADLVADIQMLQEKLRQTENALELRQLHDAADTWYWQAEGENNIGSMSNSMVVVIRAEQLRDLIPTIVPKTLRVTSGQKLRNMVHDQWVSDNGGVEAIPKSFQERVHPWMIECFGPKIAADLKERNHRFLEESLELVQACGCTLAEVYQLVDYVYGRPVGEETQEVGGVMVTLAALCNAQGMDMYECGETELARIWTKVSTIRAKQATKPQHSPLPEQSTSRLTIDVRGSAGIGKSAIAQEIAAHLISKGVHVDLNMHEHPVRIPAEHENVIRSIIGRTSPVVVNDNPGAYSRLLYSVKIDPTPFRTHEVRSHLQASEAIRQLAVQTLVETVPAKG